MLFTFLPRALTISSRHALLPDRNRSRIDSSTRAVGLILDNALTVKLLRPAEQELLELFLLLFIQAWQAAGRSGFL